LGEAGWFPWGVPLPALLGSVKPFTVTSRLGTTAPTWFSSMK
jgi:hypothetical protein